MLRVWPSCSSAVTPHGLRTENLSLYLKRASSKDSVPLSLNAIAMSTVNTFEMEPMR